MALALAPPALAGDVTVQLDASSGFVIENSTGAIERLRVDEATGNVSRNGALFVHTTGTNNLFVGAGAGNPATTGAGGNTAVGYGALYSNSTGSSNSAFGDRALYLNTTGSRNLAVGRYAGQNQTTGQRQHLPRERGRGRRSRAGSGSAPTRRTPRPSSPASMAPTWAGAALPVYREPERSARHGRRHPAAVDG